MHTSSEGKILEDPWIEAPDYVFTRTKVLEKHQINLILLILNFKMVMQLKLMEKNKPHELLSELNQKQELHGIGRVDIVENRFVGMKSRGVYETPGGTILLHAHRAIESITLDRGEAHLKDELLPKYAEIIYNGFGFHQKELQYKN